MTFDQFIDNVKAECNKRKAADPSKQVDWGKLWQVVQAILQVVLPLIVH